MPPMTKVSMKATVHIIGNSKRMRPRYMVKSQLKSLAPVGIEITIVVMPKKLLTLAPEPMVKKWCSQTMAENMAIQIIEKTNEVGTKCSLATQIQGTLDTKQNRARIRHKNHSEAKNREQENT